MKACEGMIRVGQNLYWRFIFKLILKQRTIIRMVPTLMVLVLEILQNRGWKQLLNLDKFKLLRNHWIAFYVNGSNIIYFDSFGVKHVPREVKKFSKSENVIANVNRTQAYDSIMCGYFCIKFIDFMLKGKVLLDYTN